MELLLSNAAFGRSDRSAVALFAGKTWLASTREAGVTMSVLLDRRSIHCVEGIKVVSRPAAQGSAVAMVTHVCVSQAAVAITGFSIAEVEVDGLEPTTSCVQSRRSPN